jgi:hypothetical protein
MSIQICAYACSIPPVFPQSTETRVLVVHLTVLPMAHRSHVAAAAAAAAPRFRQSAARSRPCIVQLPARTGVVCLGEFWDRNTPVGERVNSAPVRASFISLLPTETPLHSQVNAGRSRCTSIKLFYSHYDAIIIINRIFF